MNEPKSVALRGLGVSSGVGIGGIQLVYKEEIELNTSTHTTPEQEMTRLRHAVDEYCHHTYHIFQEMRNLIGREDALILGGQIMMIRDLFIMEQFEQEISQGATAEQAIDIVLGQYQAMFAEMTDEIMSQREGDIVDLRRGILAILNGKEKRQISSDHPIVLCVEEITPSMMATITTANVVAILSEMGGSTSHSAILSRSLGIPAIFGIQHLFTMVKEGMEVVVDGSEGVLYLDPPVSVQEKYRKKAKVYRAKSQKLHQFAKKPSVDGNGNSLKIKANVSDLSQIHSALDVGAEGIGIFRTEYLFLRSDTPPTEEEQFFVYARVGELMDGGDVVIRTLDLGGQLAPLSLAHDGEQNPFLGRHGLRYSMYNVPLFHTQIRAILRAHLKYPSIKIVLPLLVGVEEVAWGRTQIEQCRTQLIAEGIPLETTPKIGAMIETPASAIIADHFAREVDFFSVGTNNLLQYITAADRGNLGVSTVYNSFHLSFLRILKHIASAAKQNQIPLTLCGEVVSDPRIIPLLLSFGFDEFSVSPAAILSVRRDLSLWSRKDVAEIKKSVLKMQTCVEIEGYLNQKVKMKEQANLKE